MKDFFKKTIVYILTLEAKAVLRKYQPKIVAVTGSVGKTSTKDAVFRVLSVSHHTRKSEKSFNTEFGVPLTILGVPNGWSNPFLWAKNILDGLFLMLFTTRYPEWLVLEVGADRPGDIRSIAAWLPVDVAVITRLPEVPVHVEFFNSAEEVVEEKASLIKALKPEGVLVLYAGEQEMSVLRHRAREHSIYTFGLNRGADVHAEDIELLFETGESPPAGGWPVGMKARVVMKGAEAPVEVVGSIGKHSLLPALGAAAVGVALKKNSQEVVQGLSKYDPPPGRMRLVRGIKDTLVIDDTYNSSPAALEAALDALDMVGTRALARKIAVLGDMLELGEHSAKEHKKAGTHAAKTCDLLFTVGFRARDIAEGALDAGMPDRAILQYESAGKAARELKNMLKQKDVILVKGSQSVRMERIVEELMEEPEQAGELLVRQDEEWKKR